MNDISVYPMRFDPICHYRIWGGHRLPWFLSAPLPKDTSAGEAWILSDRDNCSSLVAEGPMRGLTIGQVIARYPLQVMGRLAGQFTRFPLLLKFLDAHDRLSVQVHPSDGQKKYLPAGEQGKTEAWVVLEADRGSLIYAGLPQGTTREKLQQALSEGRVTEHLASFEAQPGESLLLQAGTVHALGAGVMVFEVQQNSDVTFRLYDWERIDETTGKPRSLQIDQALDCIDFTRGAVGPAAPLLEEETPVRRERLIDCPHFTMWRIKGESPFIAGEEGLPRVLVCLEGRGYLEYGDLHYGLTRGGALLIPAAAGACLFQPHGPVNLLEIALPAPCS